MNRAKHGTVEAASINSSETRYRDTNKDERNKDGDYKNDAKAAVMSIPRIVFNWIDGEKTGFPTSATPVSRSGTQNTLTR